MCTNFVFFLLISLTYALVSPNCISISIVFQCLFAFILFVFSFFVYDMLVCLYGWFNVDCKVWMFVFVLLFGGSFVLFVWDECGATFACFILFIDISLTVWPFYNAFSFSCLCMQLFSLFSMQCCFASVTKISLAVVYIFIRFLFAGFPYSYTTKTHWLL